MDISINFTTSLEVYENLQKDKSSRYEFIYQIMEQKKIKLKRGDNIYLKSYGSQRTYDTNLYEGIVINDILLNGQSKITNKGYVTNYNFLVKNVNVDAKNSNKYKDKFEQSLSTNSI